VLVDVPEADCEELVEPRVLTRRAMAPDSATNATRRITMTSVAFLPLAEPPPGLPAGVIDEPLMSRSIPTAFR